MSDDKYIRPHIEQYFSLMTYVVALRSTCIISGRQYGAVVVKNNKVISTGYNGAPAGRPSCDELGFCVKREKGYGSGEKFEECIAVHAEANALLQAGKEASGADLYVNGYPCILCSRLIINAGIKRIFISGKYSSVDGLNFLREAGIRVKFIRINLKWLDILRNNILQNEEHLEIDEEKKIDEIESKLF